MGDLDPIFVAISPCGRQHLLVWEEVFLCFPFFEGWSSYFAEVTKKERDLLSSLVAHGCTEYLSPEHPVLSSNENRPKLSTARVFCLRSFFDPQARRKAFMVVSNARFCAVFNMAMGQKETPWGPQVLVYFSFYQ